MSMYCLASPCCFSKIKHPVWRFSLLPPPFFKSMLFVCVFHRPACPYHPFPATTPARLGHGGEADSPAGQSLPGADPQDRRLPLWHRDQARETTPTGQQVRFDYKRKKSELWWWLWLYFFDNWSILFILCTERWWIPWWDTSRCRSLGTGSLDMMERGTCTRLTRCPSGETGWGIT